jgi:hypothetical protein
MDNVPSNPIAAAQDEVRILNQRGLPSPALDDLLSRQMLTFSHAWSRTQKGLIIAATTVAVVAFVAFAYSYERSHRLPDEGILVGTWEMTAPPTASSFTLRLDPYDAAWHGGVWVRRDKASGELEGYSDMAWYAGGSNIYMHFDEEPPQIWQIVEILPNELRLRHAKRDYSFKRSSEKSI